MVVTGAGLIAFGKWIGEKIFDKGFEHIADGLLEIDQKNKFYKVVNKTAQQLQTTYPDVLGGNIEYFFKHDEIFHQLVKLLFVDSKIDIKIIQSHFDTETLPPDFIADFVAALRNNLMCDEHFSGIFSNKEIYVLCLGINSSLESILEVTNLSRMELSSISTMLQEKFKNEFDYSKFITHYSFSVINNLSQVNPIGLGVDMSIKKGKRKNIENVFVEPTFSIPPKTKSKWEAKNRRNSSRILGYKKLLEIDENIVILGNPGSGKSFLVKSLMCEIIRQNESRLHKILPLRVELRKYLAYKKEFSGNILSYIPNMLGDEFGIDNIPKEISDNLFDKYQVFFFFDGLDEIFNVSDRIAIKNDIENFVHHVKCQGSLTTSRIIGYEEASLNEDVFSSLIMNKFSEWQIIQYVNNWYAIEEENSIQRQKEVDDFLQKSKTVDEELISNPLLLSLIVILYRNNLKLPESKLEVYQSCTSTLVDKWDSSKQLEIELDKEVYKRKESILADLAYWQYIELSNNKAAITYERAKNSVTKSIASKLHIDDEYQAAIIAENFMSYIHKRSIYFDNNFTHKTFLEYFTAFWIYANIEKKHKKIERNGLISKYINNPFWHIVLELLFNLIDKEQADNEIMDELFLNQIEDSENSINFLLSIVRAIENISIVVVKKVLVSSIYNLVKDFQPDNPTEKQIGLFVIFTRVYNTPEYTEVDYAFADCEKLITDPTPLYYLFFEVKFAQNAENIQVPFDKTLYHNTIKNDPVLFRLDFTLSQQYSGVINKDAGIFIDFLCEYIKKFGVGESVKITDLSFRGYHVYSIFSICFRRQFCDISSLKDNLIRLFKVGFTLTNVIRNMIGTQDSEAYVNKRINFGEKLDLKEVCDKLNTSDDINSKIVILAFLYIQRQESHITNSDWQNIEVKDSEINQICSVLNAGQLDEVLKRIIKLSGLEEDEFSDLIEYNDSDE